MVKLSLIIPYYQTYELTLKLLDMLVKQITNEVEVFLVDDGCNETRLDEFKDSIKIIHLKENGGFAHALNTAMKKVKGEYVGFIDSDDMIVEDYIKTLLEVLEKKDEEIILFDWQDINNGTIVHHPNNYAIWKAIYKKEIIPRFHEDVIYSADVPFQEDLSQVDHSKFYIDKVLYLYNSNREGSLTFEKERIRKENMIRCEVIKDFTLEKFEKLEDIKRKKIDTKGKLYVGDTFKCDKEMADYLMGKNIKGEVVVKVIEVKPEYEKITLTHGDIIEENVIPLKDKEELDELTKTIEKAIKPKKKKKKISKK